MNRLICAALVLILTTPFATAAEPPRVPVGSTVDHFAIKDIDDNRRSSRDYRDSKALVLAFIGIDCPLNTQYMPRLVELAKQYQGKGVAFLGVNSNTHDSIIEVTKHARKFDVPFPVCKDFGNKLADRVGASRTPEVIVLDAERVIRYRGRIDDQFGYTDEGQAFARPKPTRRELVSALDAILAGEQVAVTETESDGCLIGRETDIADAESVTYNQHIAPIIQRSCLECHREGQIAPFALTDYDQVAGWGFMIREVVRERRMPPWHADPAHGKFRNDRALSAGEIETIERWVENGMPRGAGEPPAPPDFVEGWLLGEPDMVFHMEEPFTVPATGTIKYQWVTIDPKLKEDVWVKAVELRPGNRSVVHHILMFVLPPGQGRLDEAQKAGYFAAYAPGNNPRVFPEGYAKRIKAGSKIVFQMHYTANGTEQQDRSYVGLTLAEQPDQQQIYTYGIANPRMRLPAGASNVTVTQKHTFTQDIRLLALMPHTHLRGKSFRYDAHFDDNGDGKADRVETVLNVPRFDFNWQTSYELAKPVELPRGTTLVCTATYDNSEDNPNNPDPTKNVRWGPQTWDEMMIGYIDYVPTTGAREPTGGTEGERRQRAAIKAFFPSMDRDKNGKLEESEVPSAFRRAFRSLIADFDADGDGMLTREELEQLRE